MAWRNCFTTLCMGFRCQCCCPDNSKLEFDTGTDKIRLKVKDAACVYLPLPKIEGVDNKEDRKARAHLIGAIHTRERCWSWGKSFCDFGFDVAIVCNLVACGIAIGQLFVDNNRAAIVSLAVSQFTVLTFGIIAQIRMNYTSRLDIGKLRSVEGRGGRLTCLSGNTVGMWGMDLSIAGFSLALAATAMVTKIVVGDPVGDILSFLAPAVSSTGLSIIQNRLGTEKQIISERYARHLLSTEIMLEVQDIQLEVQEYDIQTKAKLIIDNVKQVIEGAWNADLSKSIENIQRSANDINKPENSLEMRINAVDIARNASKIIKI